MRQMFQLLGAQVTWDSSTKTVVAARGGRTISLTIGAKQALVNGREHTLDMPAYVEGGVMFVPLRFVSESLGAEVSYDPTAREARVEFEGRSWCIQVPVPAPCAPGPLSASGAARFFLQHAAHYGAPAPVGMGFSQLKSDGRVVRFSYRSSALLLSGKPTTASINVLIELSRDQRGIAFYQATIASGPFTGLPVVTGTSRD